MKIKTCIFAILLTAVLINSHAQDTWTQKANFPAGFGRYAVAGFSIGSKGYMGTGYDVSLGHQKDLWEYDPVTNAWTQKADIGGVARGAAVAFAINGKGYIGTGSNFAGDYKDFWEYDPVSNTWTRKADFGGTARDFAVGFSIGSKGYIGTGNDGINNHKDFWEYDPSTNVWTQKIDFAGTARTWATGFSIGSKGYIGTGFDNVSFYKDFWEYDPAINGWTQKADFGGTARAGAGGLSIGTKGYIGTGNDNTALTKDFWEYDPAANSWTRKADFGGAVRWYPAGFSIGNKGYVGTGIDYPTHFKDFWEYTPTGGNLIPGSTALRFDGATQWVTLRYWDMSTLSLESWIKLDASATGGPFLSRQEDLILGVAEGKAYLQLELGGGNWQVLQSEQTLAPDIWYHIAGTYDHATMRIYVNGQLGGELAATGSLFHDVCTDYWSIGAAYDRCSNSYFALFAGEVDEVRVWNYARTQDEILSTLYTSLTGKETGLVGYWPLDERSGQVAVDKSGHGRDGTLGSTPEVDKNDPDWVTDGGNSGACIPPPLGLVSWWSGDKTAEDLQGINPGVLLSGTSFRPGKVGPGFAFNGVNGGVKIPNSPSLSQTRITLDAWVYVTGRQGTARHIISKDNSSRTREYILGIGSENSFVADVWLTSGFVELRNTTIVQLSNWYHVAMTYDGLKLRLYVNGVLDGTADAVGDIVTTTNPVGIGWNVDPLISVFQGIIDEAQIYSRVLTDAEILAIYQAGAHGQCKPNIFVASIDPSFQTRGHQYLISTSVTIQDVNGVGIEDATTTIKTTFPDRSVLTFPAITDRTGQATISFYSTAPGRYQFKVQRVNHPTREYDASLNIETSDTLVIP